MWLLTPVIIWGNAEIFRHANLSAGVHFRLYSGSFDCVLLFKKHVHYVDTANNTRHGSNH